jgi:hypothetical protein
MILGPAIRRSVSLKYSVNRLKVAQELVMQVTTDAQNATVGPLLPHRREPYAQAMTDLTQRKRITARRCGHLWDLFGF